MPGTGTIVRHQEIGTGFASIGNLAVAVKPAAGNVIIAWANSDTTIAVSDNVGGTWALGVSIIDGNGTYVWWRHATPTDASSLTTVTFTPTGSNENNAGYMELGGCVTSNAKDVTGSAQAGAQAGATPAITSAPVTTGTDGDIALCVGFWHSTGAAPATTGTTWTGGFTDIPLSPGWDTDGGSHTTGTMISYLNTSGPTAVNSVASWTNGNRGDRETEIITFKLARPAWTVLQSASLNSFAFGANVSLALPSPLTAGSKIIGIGILNTWSSGGGWASPGGVYTKPSWNGGFDTTGGAASISPAIIADQPYRFTDGSAVPPTSGTDVRKDGGRMTVWAGDTVGSLVGTKPNFLLSTDGTPGITLVLLEVAGLPAGTTGILDGTPGILAGSSGTTPGLASYASAAPGEMLLNIFGLAGDNTNVVTYTPPAGYTAYMNNTSTNTTSTGAIGTAIKSSTGGTETGTFTTSATSVEWFSIVLAFGGGTPPGSAIITPSTIACVATVPAPTVTGAVSPAGGVVTQRLSPSEIFTPSVTSLTLSNTSTQWSGNVATTDLMVVQVAVSCDTSGTVAAPTVTDDNPGGSNTYTLKASAANNTSGTDKPGLYLFTAPIATGGRKPVITVAWNQTGASGLGASFSAETISGLQAAVDVSASGIAAFASATCSTGTTSATTAAGEFGIAIGADCGNNLTMTAGSGAGTIGGAGYTKDATLSNDLSVNQGLFVSFNPTVGNATATGGTIAYSRTVDDKVALVAVFKLASPAVTFDAVGPSSSAMHTNLVSNTWSHTCSGASRMVFVACTFDRAPDTGTTLGATYDGVAMTSVGIAETGSPTSASGFVQGWYLVNPPTGTKTVVVTATGGSLPGNGLAGGSVSFNGVDQTTPVRNFVAISADGGGGGTLGITENISSATGNMVIAACCYGGSGTITSGQTLRVEGGSSGAGAGTIGIGTAAGASSVTMSFATVGPTDWWGEFGVDIVAASGGGGTGATVTPSAVACVAAIPAPAISAGRGATVSPATVAAKAAVPAPTITTIKNATVTPVVVSAVAAVPAPALSTGRTVTPASVVATASVPSPTISAIKSATVNPVTVSALASVPAPTVLTSSGATVTPTSVVARAAVPAPVISISSLVNPTSVSAPAVVPAPALSTGSTASPASVSALAAVPAPNIGTSVSAIVSPATVQAKAAVPAPSVIVGISAIVSPASVGCIVAISAPGLSTGSVVAPASVAAVAYVPSPAGSAGTVVHPLTVSGTAVVGAPGLSAGGSTTVTPLTVSVKVAVPAIVPFIGPPAGPSATVVEAEADEVTVSVTSSWVSVSVTSSVVEVAISTSTTEGEDVTLYAGKRVRISASVQDYDGQMLSPVNSLVVKVTIYNLDGITPLITAATMNWNGARSIYEYFWDSPPVEGAYNCEVDVASDLVNSAGKKPIRLRKLANA